MINAEVLQEQAREKIMDLMKRKYKVLDIDHDITDDSYVIRVENPKDIFCFDEEKMHYHIYEK